MAEETKRTKPFQAIALAIMPNGKEGIVEFDVTIKDGKTYAIIGLTPDGRLLELEELDPSRLLTKSDPHEYFYLARLKLDKGAN